jgi:hypothetical protein
LLTAEQVTSWVNANTDTNALAAHLIARRNRELNVIATTTLAPPF